MDSMKAHPQSSFAKSLMQPRWMFRYVYSSDEHVRKPGDVHDCKNGLGRGPQGVCCMKGVSDLIELRLHVCVPVTMPAVASA